MYFNPLIVDNRATCLRGLICYSCNMKMSLLIGQMHGNEGIRSQYYNRFDWISVCTATSLPVPRPTAPRHVMMRRKRDELAREQGKPNEEIACDRETCTGG